MGRLSEARKILLGEATPSWRLVGKASYSLETSHLASDGLDEDPQSSSY
jgi:hypothetical protein